MKATLEAVMDAVDALPEAATALDSDKHKVLYCAALAACLNSLGWTELEYDEALGRAVEAEFWRSPTRSYCAPVAYIGHPINPFGCNDDVSFPNDDEIPF